MSSDRVLCRSIKIEKLDCFYCQIKKVVGKVRVLITVNLRGKHDIRKKNNRL